MDPKKNRYVLLFTLAALVTGALVGFRTLAQSTNLAPNTPPANVMAGYAESARKALVSGTEATNLTDAEVGRLLNESIKTNLAAQLWFRQAMGGTSPAMGRKWLRSFESWKTCAQGAPTMRFASWKTASTVTLFSCQ